MDVATRAAIVDELGAAFGGAEDVTPGNGQPLHLLLPTLHIPQPWKSPSRALLRFANWPIERPGFWIAVDVVNAQGAPPRSNWEEFVLGESWRAFSFRFTWSGTETPTLAVQKWLVRFREST